jgi:hypothetical protein
MNLGDKLHADHELRQPYPSRLKDSSVYKNNLNLSKSLNSLNRTMIPVICTAPLSAKVLFL